MTLLSYEPSTLEAIGLGAGVTVAIFLVGYLIDLLVCSLADERMKRRW